MNKAWLFVFGAGIFEIGWVVGLKYANTWWSWGLTVVAIYACMHLLLIASKRLPVGTTYVVFTGMGTTGTVLLDMLVFGEPFQVAKLLLIVVLLIGVIGLKAVTVEQEGDR
ncbi:QacE family quaternary ammonium compound efflux SMR transporter [Ornithinibacillus sp. L9]|uniref:QacE family quaternary ammonium compound efflux SMR transporter n=1 Tax=Ornithinibacillus caprae TaxID=2678566 RepID=A0A6N8FJZ4_9BACI|nr:SMR family transporter [Ornithinibacillus caprae]MUK89972.1 QacE family quaternary ammonium compound efflux SMR transporter [Ornithinibacillus caprae]